MSASWPSLWYSHLAKNRRAAWSPASAIIAGRTIEAVIGAEIRGGVAAGGAVS
jgi:hypothetical protein